MFGWRQRPGPGIPIALIWGIKLRWVPGLLLGVSSLGSIPTHRQWIMAMEYKGGHVTWYRHCSAVAVVCSLSLALNGSPAGPQCSGLTEQAPAPQIPCFPAHSRVCTLAYRATETPKGSWQRTKVKDIPLPHCHLYSVCLFVNYISNGGRNKTW